VVGWATYAPPESPTLTEASRFEPVCPWDRPRPIPSAALISNKAIVGRKAGNKLIVEGEEFHGHQDHPVEPPGNGSQKDPE
jgi:hypothetical protein